MVAEHFTRPETAARIRKLLAPESPEEASVWADEYRRDHRETGPWHYIDIPLEIRPGTWVFQPAGRVT
jgi:hypothetical protein